MDNCSKWGDEKHLNYIENVDDYDPGLLNSYGGGNIQWWQGYIRAEINKCNEHWRSIIIGYKEIDDNE